MWLHSFASWRNSGVLFPDDDNGDVLRRMFAKGDNLSRPREINFSVVFPDEESAKRFLAHFQQEGFFASIERSAVTVDLPWDVTVVRSMAPTHHEIGEFEDRL
jgi:hypothetical protein